MLRRTANSEARRSAGKPKFGTNTVLGCAYLAKKSGRSGTPCGPHPAAPKTQKLRKSFEACVCGGKNAAILNFSEFV